MYASLYIEGRVVHAARMWWMLRPVNGPWSPLEMQVDGS